MENYHAQLRESGGGEAIGVQGRRSDEESVGFASGQAGAET